MQNKTKELILMIITTIGFTSFILIINKLVITATFFFIWLLFIIDIKSMYRGYKNNIYFLASALAIVAVFGLIFSRNEFGFTIDNLLFLILFLGISTEFIIKLKNRNDKNDYKNEWKI